MADIYYYPEENGLTIVATAEESLSYEFDMLVVWKEDSTGYLYYGQDSGCSCPSPFEDLDSIEGLDRIVTQEDWNRFERMAREWNREARDTDSNKTDIGYFLKSAHDAWKCPYCHEVACENERCITLKSIARTVDYGY